MARAPGIEPGPAGLEPAALPIELHPHEFLDAGTGFEPVSSRSEHGVLPVKLSRNGWASWIRTKKSLRSKIGRVTYYTNAQHNSGPVFNKSWASDLTSSRFRVPLASSGRHHSPALCQRAPRIYDRGLVGERRRGNLLPLPTPAAPIQRPSALASATPPGPLGHGEQSGPVASAGNLALSWSGRPDSNWRPELPKSSALPGCATPRKRRMEEPRPLGAPQQRSTALGP